MVESTKEEKKDDGGFTFEDLMTEQRESEVDKLKNKQQSMFVKDLKEKYRPEQVEGYVAP